jgi:hypothetical protein
MTRIVTPYTCVVMAELEHENYSVFYFSSGNITNLGLFS